MTTPTIDDFEREIRRRIADARARGAAYIDIRAGELHRDLGGIPDTLDAMTCCCEAMYRVLGPHDKVRNAPPKGSGPSLVIRYNLATRSAAAGTR